MDRAELASVKHRNGYNCCQAVVCVFADKVGIDESLLYKMGEGFGAGMGTAQQSMWKVRVSLATTKHT